MSNNEFETSKKFNLNEEKQNVIINESNDLNNHQIPTFNQKFTNFSNLSLFSSYLSNQLEIDLNTNLTDECKNLIFTNLNDYEQFHSRRLEEKDLIINQLKQNLIDLTEKRFRQSQAQLNDESIQFLLNEKETKISLLLSELSEKENEILKLKQIIKDQDDVILNHNNNIYELKNNNQAVLKAKQDSFRMMNEEMSNKQKLIDDQTQVIKSLKEKIETLEEQYDNSRIDLEKRLNEKETDLLVKIANFEANLHEGKHYFEEVLSEKLAEINQLKIKLAKYETNENESNTSIDTSNLEDPSNLLSSSLLNQSGSKQKADSESLKTIKSLYDHQIELLKVKIEMLEKTCNNYQQGIKEMNKNFGLKQQNDEASSIQIFKDLMQDLQKTNVSLETAKIDLEVKCNNLQNSLDQIKIEKENLNKKFINTDQLNQKLTSERVEFENYYRSQIESKTFEVNELSQQIYSLRNDYEILRQDNIRLGQISLEYDQLKLTNQELTQHYEALHQQATDIVNGNQLLNEQVQTNNQQITELETQIKDLTLQVDHLTSTNSELNTQKVNYEMKVQVLEEELNNLTNNLKELDFLRAMKLDTELLEEKIKDFELEINEKNELIEQLNQAKEFLAENNSKLLTNNIKIQLFIESLGLDQSEMENNQRVKEYDDLIEKLKQTEFDLLNLKSLNQELESNYVDLKSKLKIEIDKKDLEIQNLKQQLTQIIRPEQMDQQTQSDHVENLKLNSIDQETQSDLDLPQQPNQQFLDQLRLYENNMIELQNENDALIDEINLLKENNKHQVSSGEELKELKDLKQKYDDLSKLNLKLKAKLKQVLPKKDEKKVETTPVKSQNHTDELDEIQSQNIELRNLKITDENIFLIDFGAKIANEKLEKEILAELSLLKLDLNILLLHHKTEIETNEKHKSDLKDQITNLEAQLNDKLNEIKILKSASNSSWQNDWDNVNTDELDSLKAQIQELEVNLCKKTSEVSELSDECENWKKKYEQMRVKAIALKEKLKKFDLTAQSSQNPSPRSSYESHNLAETLFHDLQKEFEEFKKSHVLEIENLNKSYIDQIKVYEANFVDLQNENDNLQADFDQLKLDYDNLQLKSKKEVNSESKINELESLVKDLNLKINDFEDHEVDLKDQLLKSNQLKQDLENKNLILLQENDSLKIKLKETQDQNLKLKAKLKQLLVKQKEANNQEIQKESLLTINTSDEHQISRSHTPLSVYNHSPAQLDSSSTQTDFQSDLQIKINDLEIQNDNLQQIIKQFDNERHDLTSKYTAQSQEYETSKLKLKETQEQNLKLKAKLKQLIVKEKEAELKSRPLTPVQHNQTETKSTQTEEYLHEIENLKTEKNKLENLIEELRSQVKDYELYKNDLENQVGSFNQQNQFLSEKISSLELEKNDLLTQFNLKISELDDLRLKLKELQDQNLKLKAKLKQLIVKEKEAELKSRPLTPVHDNKTTESNSTQTDEDENLNDKCNQLSSKNNELESIINDLNSKINNYESEKNEILKSFESNKLDLDDIREKLKTTQEQNLKLKAKLKQVLTKEKEVKLNETNSNEIHKQNVQNLNSSDDKSIRPDQPMLNENENELKNQIEILNTKNNRLELLINELNEKVLFYENEGNYLRKELNELRFKLEAKTSVELNNSHSQTEELGLEELIKIKTAELDSCYKKLSELETLIDLKQKMNDSLLNQSNELKNMIEQQRYQYEAQLNSLTISLNQKETCLIELNNEIISLKNQQFVNNPTSSASCLLHVSTTNHNLDEFNSDQKVSPATSIGAASSVNSNLETQLKYCHEKCEKVVAKLSQLKKQNESLNSKIKSIKSMIYS